MSHLWLKMNPLGEAYYPSECFACEFYPLVFLAFGDELGQLYAPDGDLTGIKGSRPHRYEFPPTTSRFGLALHGLFCLPHASPMPFPAVGAVLCM